MRTYCELTVRAFVHYVRQIKNEWKYYNNGSEDNDRKLLVLVENKSCLTANKTLYLHLKDRKSQEQSTRGMIWFIPWYKIISGHNCLDVRLLIAQKPCPEWDFSLPQEIKPAHSNISPKQRFKTMLCHYYTKNVTITRFHLWEARK